MNTQLRNFLINLKHDIDNDKFCKQDAYYLSMRIGKFFEPDLSIENYNIVKKGLDCEKWCDARELTEKGMCKLIDRCWADLEEGFERVEQ